MLLVTPVVASLLTLFYVRLTFNAIGLRRSLEVSLGDGGHEVMGAPPKERLQPTGCAAWWSLC